METTQEKIKSFYEEWIASQNKFMQNWFSSAQGAQKAMTGNATESATEYYKKWADQQSNYYKRWEEMVSNFQKSFPAAIGGDHAFKLPNFMNPEMGASGFKDYIDNQNKFMQSFLSGANPFANYFSQHGFKQNGSANQLFNLYENWNNIYSNFAQWVGKNYDETMKNYANVNKETLNGVFGSSETYVKLLEFWMPIYKAMQDKTITPELLQQYIHPARYKEVLDKVFEFASPEMLHDFYNQAGKVMETMSGHAQTQLKRYNEMMEHNTKILPELMSGDPQAAMKIYESMYEAYQKNVDPMIKANMGGKDTEVIETLKDIVAKYTEYASRFSKFQYKVYTTGQKAMEQSMEKTYAAYKDKAEVKSFNDFFKSWTDVNENAFTEVFKTEEFSQIQGEMVNISSDIKSDFQKLMEISLADYPVVPRSEMDELYKTVQELKNKVRQLEKNGHDAPAAHEEHATEENKAAAGKKAPLKKA